MSATIKSLYTDESVRLSAGLLEGTIAIRSHGNLVVNAVDLLSAVSENTGQVFIEPKKAEFPWEFGLMYGVSLDTEETVTAANLREAAAHYLALAQEKDDEEAAKEAARRAEVDKVMPAVTVLYSGNMDTLTLTEFAKALVEAGLTVKEEN